MTTDPMFNVFKDLAEAGSTEVEKWRDMATELGSRLDSLLNRYVELVNCGDCGNWNPEEEMVVKAARRAIERYSKL